MSSSEKIEAFYAREHPFKQGLAMLREIAHKTELEESLKWGAPVYMVDGKNVLGIMAFKSHFGLWFFNGVFLEDPKKVLQNAQEGKTKAMRHWKFTSVDEIDKATVLAYMKEAIENQKKGMELKPERKAGKVEMPGILTDALRENKKLKAAFDDLTPFKQREFAEYLDEAKLQKTKVSRLDKIIPLIEKGMGLHDKYR
jgi:uncharacterized protein YdeI (YjbR/CyaY-like superfamily)